MSRTIDYDGYIEVTIKTRYRIFTQVSHDPPSKAEILQILRNDECDEVMETGEELAIVSVDNVGKNKYDEEL
jgi:tRNA U34 5-carboxymethylaminomethyl modifying GTPase MnmE/TrmE